MHFETVKRFACLTSRQDAKFKYASSDGSAVIPLPAQIHYAFSAKHMLLKAKTDFNADFHGRKSINFWGPPRPLTSTGRLRVDSVTREPFDSAGREQLRAISGCDCAC